MTPKPCAVLTGSTKGIGFSIATELAKLGFIPILNYRSDQSTAARALKEIRELSPDAQIVQADVSTKSGAQSLFEAASKLGHVDILVNNVGQFHDKPFLETSISEWKEILDSNLTSAVLCCQQVLPSMRARARGHIINIASMHADQIRARPHTLPYAIGKAGIIHLTQTLAKTEGAYGIRVNAVGPGFINGGEHTHPEHVAHVALGALGQPEDVAKAVRFLISEDAQYITGALLNINGGALL
ncbi:SDR family oxidoreductase [Candidatus Bipolaricaulota bacterium]|nr:SDR family oxidoreductase [Candidatus Bipolaricaulota bacterium]